MVPLGRTHNGDWSNMVNDYGQCLPQALHQATTSGQVEFSGAEQIVPAEERYPVLIQHAVAVKVLVMRTDPSHERIGQLQQVHRGYRTLMAPKEVPVEATGKLAYVQPGWLGDR